MFEPDDMENPNDVIHEDLHISPEGDEFEPEREESEEDDFDVDDDMDGDHDSAMTSIGWGTDEDYGDYGGGNDDY